MPNAVEIRHLSEFEGHDFRQAPRRGQLMRHAGNATLASPGDMPCLELHTHHTKTTIPQGLDSPVGFGLGNALLLGASPTIVKIFPFAVSGKKPRRRERQSQQPFRTLPCTATKDQRRFPRREIFQNQGKASTRGCWRCHWARLKLNL